MSIVLIVIIILIVLFVIGIMFSSDESGNKNTYDNSQQNSIHKKSPPPNYRYWNQIEYNGNEVRCDWCAYLRTEKETGRKYCSKYPGYVDLDYVCDSYVSGVETLAKDLSNIVLNDNKDD